MQTRDFSLKIKSLTDDGTFTGLASTYGTTDLQGDVILAGAFARTLASQPANGFPLLFCHMSDQPLGTATVSDSKTGLVVQGKMVLADPNAVRVLAHLKAGGLKGLSIGFDIPNPDSVSYDDAGRRILSEIRLWEVSVVAIPANPLAQITSVKSLADAERYILGIKAAGPDAEMVNHLRAIHSHVLTLLGDAYPEPDDDDAEDSEDDDDAEDEKAFMLSELEALAAEVAELAGA
jgi:uncharacterized protein